MKQFIKATFWSLLFLLGFFFLFGFASWDFELFLKPGLYRGILTGSIISGFCWWLGETFLTLK